MPQKKKAIPVSGYAVFVKHLRAQYEKEGKFFPKKNQEAFLFADPMWKELSEEERKRYNGMAKSIKRQGASDLESKYNAHGVSFADLEVDKREKEEYNNIMMNTIRNTVRDSDFNTTFKTQKFYLCHVNYFYVNSSDRFKPAEIALIEFNLKKGVLSRFHAFVDPGPIEQGFRFKAMQQLELTHQIPIEDPKWTCGEKDYLKLFSDIKQFLCKDNPTGRIPPIFSMPDDENNNYSLMAVKSTMETLCEAASEDPSEFRIYELPLLYHEFRRKAIAESSMKDVEKANSITLSMTYQDIEKDLFSYSKGIACHYHETKDICTFCSLSMVTRWVYSMCDFLLNFIPENPIEGGHVPWNSIKASEVLSRFEDIKDKLPLRKPHLQPAPVTLKKNEAFSDFEDANDSDSAPSQSYSKVAQSKSQPSQPMFQSAVKRSDLSTRRHENHMVDQTNSGAFDDACSSVATLNLSQSTVLSGYTAGASLSQSSYSSEVSIDGFPFLGRGRGMPKSSQSDQTNCWAMSAGRGSRLRQQPSPF